MKKITLYDGGNGDEGDDDDDKRLIMAYDCRVRNMNCFGAKAASANSVAHLTKEEEDNNGDYNGGGVDDDN